MAKLTITIKAEALKDLVDCIWQGGRPTDPPLVAEDVEKGIKEVPAPPLDDLECARRWVVRELRGRLHQWRKEMAAKDATEKVAEDLSVE